MNSQPRITSKPTAKNAHRRCHFLFISAFPILIGLAGCSDQDGASSQGSEQKASAVEVGVIEVQPKTIDRRNLLPGRVVPYQVAEIRPQVSGIIQSRSFIEGSFVEEGQQLYQIDAARYEADLEMAQANLEDAEARRLYAQALTTRVEKLVKANSVSEQEYDDAVLSLNQAKAAISMAKAEVRMAGINLDYTEVRSPISGYISPSTVTKGALVSERQELPLATVRQLDQVYIDLSQSAAGARDLLERLTAARLDSEGGGQVHSKALPNRHQRTLST